MSKSFKDSAGAGLYLMPAFHGPLSPLQHVALLSLRLQDTAEASTQTLYYFPAVLWGGRDSLRADTHAQIKVAERFGNIL